MESIERVGPSYGGVGERSATISLKELVAGEHALAPGLESAEDRRAGSGGTLTLHFDMERTPPIDLRLEYGPSLVRTALHTWQAYVPPDLVARQLELKAVWIDPGERVVLTEKSVDPSAEPRLVPIDFVGTYRDVVDEVRQCSPPALIDSCILWASIDLATSLESTKHQRCEVARVLGISPSLFDSLGQTRIEGLRTYLETRWRTRAALSAGGIDPDPYLPPSVAFDRVAVDVCRLLLAVFRSVFDTSPGYPLQVEKVWDAAFAFANGRLRRIPNKRSRDKFNLEPNSAALASMAELMDVALCAELENTAEMMDQCAGLRAAFVSILEPYFQVYAPESGGAVATAYRPGNLARRLPNHDPRWTDTAFVKLKNEYGKMGEVELKMRWGKTLASALRDEPNVRSAGRHQKPCALPTP